MKYKVNDNKYIEINCFEDPHNGGETYLLITNAQGWYHNTNGPAIVHALFQNYWINGLSVPVETLSDPEVFETLTILNIL